MIPMFHHQRAFDYMEQPSAMRLTKKSSIFGDMQDFWNQPHATYQTNVPEPLDLVQIQRKEKSFEFPEDTDQVEYNDFSLDNHQEIKFEQESEKPVQIKEELKYEPLKIDANP